jgi:type II secretory pathway component HofQ
MRARRGLEAYALLVMLMGAFAPALHAQTEPPVSQARRVSVTWEEAPIAEVLRAFAAVSGISIVAGADVTGFVTADINDQPWDVALRTILSSQGLRAVEGPVGILRIESFTGANEDETVEPLVTRTYRLSISRASELQAAVAPLLSPRGGIAVLESTNTLVVTDVGRVHRAVAPLLR